MPVTVDAAPTSGLEHLDYDASSPMIPTRISSPIGCRRDADASAILQLAYALFG